MTAKRIQRGKFKEWQPFLSGLCLGCEEMSTLSYSYAYHVFSRVLKEATFSLLLQFYCCNEKNTLAKGNLDGRVRMDYY